MTIAGLRVFYLHGFERWHADAKRQFLQIKYLR